MSTPVRPRPQSFPDAQPLPADAPWIVLKFGGTSVSARHRWDNIGRIARDSRREGARVLIVVSALSGVTDALKGIAEASDATDRATRAATLVDRHLSFCTSLGLAPPAPLNAGLKRLQALLEDVRAPARALSWQAELLGLGEALSSAIGAAYLSATVLPVGWIDARDWLTASSPPNSTEWSRYLSASCETRPSPAAAAALAEAGEVLITQGFIARGLGGEPVILGRGGSDTSASLFGALLGAKRVEIWTDVPGMFTANPRRVPQARLLQRLDYDEAQEIATTGAKVLHPRCIAPCREHGVPLSIRDTERPALPGTQIAAAGLDVPPCVKAISARSGITLVSMESIGMWQQVGFLADVFGLFKKHGLSVDLIGSAETNVTVSLDPSENLINDDTLQRLTADLAAICRVKVIAPCAAITLVGRGIRALLHRLSPVLAELGAERVHLISQSSNNLNLTFVVDEALADAFVPAAHALLLKAGVIAADDASLYGPSWQSLSTPPSMDRMLPWWKRRRDELLALGREGPAYVYDLSVVRQQARQLTQIGAVDRWFYAMKANGHPEVLRTLVAEGFGIECVSQGEVEHVLAHFPELSHDRILFTPNFAPAAEYGHALKEGVRVTVDNLEVLRRHPAMFRGRHLIVRFDLGRGRGHHDKVKTGGEKSKFGLALSDIADLRALGVMVGFEVVGLHAHLGSGITDAGHWREVYSELATLAESFPHAAIVNLGGGLGVPAKLDDPALDLTALKQALSEVKAYYPQLQLWMEPGRWLVADAGVLLARVTQTKRKGKSRYVGLETGMNSLLRPALYDAWHEIVNLTRLYEPNELRCEVVGPICESGDVLGQGRMLPACTEGDVMLISQAGAYGAVMGSNYNRRPPAREVVL
ncbi:MAG: bifunctional aspartate kinase/diaminopimelate decarboxylase [Xanthomonadales bacterium]|jgi:diaminopimelate decarboxylase/aspartate kinase|nr:bifunctional aspartate kinase/diaminopimelate decarboxylase [Xanthomonadales bacterium]